VSGPGRLHPVRGRLAGTRRPLPRATCRGDLKAFSDMSQVFHRPRTERHPETEEQPNTAARTPARSARAPPERRKRRREPVCDQSRFVRGLAHNRRPAARKTTRNPDATPPAGATATPHPVWVTCRLRPRLHPPAGPDPPARRAQRASCARVFRDVGSGTIRKRPHLEACLDYLRAGDTLVVWRLDRLGRSLRHLVDVAALLEQRHVAFRSLRESIDTTTANRQAAAAPLRRPGGI
jgi:hypothetical protein